MGFGGLVALALVGSQAFAGDGVDFDLGACPQVTGSLVIGRQGQTVTMHLTSWTDQADPSHVQMMVRLDAIDIVGEKNENYRTNARMLVEQKLVADKNGYPVQNSISFLKDIEIASASANGKPLNASQKEEMRRKFAAILVDEMGQTAAVSGTGLWPYLLKGVVEDGKAYRLTQFDQALIYMSSLRLKALNEPPAQRTAGEAAAAKADPTMLRDLAGSFRRRHPQAYPCLKRTRYQVTKAIGAGRWRVVTDSPIFQLGGSPMKIQTEVEMDRRLCVYEMRAENRSESEAAKAAFETITFLPD
jgi:hypothetical protein